MGTLYLSRAALATTLIASSLGHAKETALDNVLVTATRTSQTADDALASVTVITRDDIKHSQANNVQELLRGLPGMDLTTSGGYGKSTSLYLRGTNPGQTLVLVDGVKIGSATVPGASWQFLPIGEIERIEIVRGPRSSIYGSEAIGGVVQIFTRKGEGPVRPDAQITVGSFHTSDTKVGLSGSVGDSWFSVSGGRFATRGINARIPAAPTVNEPDHDGIDNRYGHFRTGYRLGKKTEVEIYALSSHGNTEFDTTPTSANETNFRETAGGVQLRSRFTPTWHTSLLAGESRDNNYNFRADGVGTPSRFDTKRYIQSWQNDISLASRQLLTVGLDKQEDRVVSTTNFTKTSRDNDAWFAVYQGDFDNHSFQTSLRSDDNDQFGKHTTGSVAYGYALAPTQRAFISYGTGFRAPTFTDLYNPGTFAAGNPNLLPEEAESIELGLKGRSSTTRWEMGLFHTRIENLIILTGSNFIPANVSRATINGLEITGAKTIDAWEIAGNVTWLDPRDDATDKYLRRRSRYFGRFDIDRHAGKNTLLGANLVSYGPRYDDDANTIRLGGYTLLNLRLEQILASAWRLGVRAENLMDKEYQTTAGFNSIGRAFFMTLSYQPTVK